MKYNDMTQPMKGRPATSIEIEAVSAIAKLQDEVLEARQNALIWRPESQKPQPYKTVLLAVADDLLTTGHWADKVGCWVGLALNQSPPTYPLATGAVTHWAYIPIN